MLSTVFMFPDMFKPHIANAKLKMPEDYLDYNPKEFPHFHVFMSTHFGQAIDIESLEDNANIIADIPNDEIMTITFKDLLPRLQMGDENNLA